MYPNTTKNLTHTFGALVLASVGLFSSSAPAQILPHQDFSVGPLTDFVISPAFLPMTRMPRTMTQRKDPIPNLPANDFAEYAFGTANIGTPFQSSTVPLFGASGLPNYLGGPDVLNNPGTHYNSLQLNAPFVIKRAFQRNDIPQPPITEPSFDGSRFDGATATIEQGKITGSITDNKQTFGDGGASWGVVAFEETYEVSTTQDISFGAALAFNISLPKSILAINQIPGAAAVALVTTLVASPGTVVLDRSTGFAIDANCFRVGSLVVSVSEGVADGLDNLNGGLQENNFGNADVGSIVGGDFFDLTGGVTISSTTTNPEFGYPGLTEDYQVAGTWETPDLRFSNSSGPVKVTLRHTLTMIADPGAEIALRALTNDEFALLPHSADVYVIAAGTIVPEPGSAALLCCGSVVLGSFMLRQRRCLRGGRKSSGHRILSQAILVGSIVAVANVGWAQVWDETINGGGDAADLPPFEQKPIGSGPLTTITGSIYNPDLDVDMYCININDPNNFSATVTTATTFERSQLFLFDAAGQGVAHQVDSTFSGVYTTTIASPFLPPPPPGMFLLAISRPDLDPVDVINSPLFVPNNPQVQVSGNVAAGLIHHWTYPSGSGSPGLYTINLTGASYCVVPEPANVVLVYCGALIAGGYAVRCRKGVQFRVR